MKKLRLREGWLNMVGPESEPWSNSEVYTLNDNLLPYKMELITPTHSDVRKAQHRRHLVRMAVPAIVMLKVLWEG